MVKSSFSARIHNGNLVIGTLVTVNSPEVVEALSMCGFDWIFIDMEHGALDIADTQALVRATAGDCLALVRVPENSGVWIRRVLDIGCDGVIVPLVCSAAEAQRAVDAARYPPEGHRSVGVGRAHAYGLQFADYVSRANERVAVIIQIEHIDAIERIDEILDVTGIDGLLIGPYDLSGSMNRLGDVQHPDVQGAISRVREICHERKMSVGIFVLDPAGALAEIARGLDFLAVGTDMSFMTATAARALDIARNPAST